MADKKISQLPVASALNGADFVPITQSGLTTKTTMGGITTFVTLDTLPKNVVVEQQATSIILAIGDINKFIYINDSSVNTITVNDAIFNQGNNVTICQYGAGVTRFIAGAGMTIRSDGGKLKIAARYSCATLMFIAPNECILFGNLMV